MCHATVAASGDGGASRPVRRPADLDTDIERVRERGRDSRRRGREGGAAELTRARVYTRERFMGETVGTTRTSFRDPFHRTRAAPPIFQRRERKRITHVTRLRRSCRGIPGFETGFSNVRVAGLATHVAPVPRTAGSTGESKADELKEESRERAQD